MTTNDITVKMIYRQVTMCNSTYSTITNRYEEGNSYLAQGVILDYLPESSLAYKIMKQMKQTLSPKQAWVIAYELMKNEAYKQTVVDYFHEAYGEDIDAEDLPTWEC